MAFPKSLECPITYEMMKKAVIAPDGYTYDLDNITECLRINGKSPFTNMPMHKYNVLNLSFKTNEISKNMSEQTSAYIFDRSVHIDGYKIIDEVDNSCSL